MRHWCIVHHAWDSDGDWECAKYATARPEMQEYLASCSIIVVTDRTVHAVLRDDTEVVRYDTAGKWYAEPLPTRLIPRQKLTVGQAAQMVKNDSEAFINFGQPGGSTFDRLVRS